MRGDELKLAEILSEKEARVIDYLKALSRGSNKRIEFNINDAIGSISMPREEIEELLASLEEKGFIKIIKAPSSKCFLDLVKKKLVPIDSAFLAGEISLNEYTKQWEEVVSCITDPIAKNKFTPLPPAELSDIVNGLNNLLNYIERLAKEEVSREIREKLARSYNEEFRRSLDLLNRYLEAIESALEINRSLINTETKEIEAIEVDEKIRNIDRSAEKKIKEERIKKAQQSLEKILMKIEGESPMKEDEELSKLEYELKKLKEEYELTEARAIIESDEALRKKAEALKNAIENIQRDIETLKSKITEQSQKKDIRKNLQNILERARKFSQEKMLWSENLQKLNELEMQLNKIYRKGK